MEVLSQFAHRPGRRKTHKPKNNYIKSDLSKIEVSTTSHVAAPFVVVDLPGLGNKKAFCSCFLRNVELNFLKFYLITAVCLKTKLYRWFLV
jgi:thermostable 8-oxoguanine DNA glycosylase